MRLMIYEMYFEQHRKDTPPYWKPNTRKEWFFAPRLRGERLRRHVAVLKDVQQSMIDDHYERAGYYPPVYEAYNRYAEEYTHQLAGSRTALRLPETPDLHMHKCQGRRCNKEQNTHQKDYVRVSARGNLMLCLPPLCRANQQLFRETWKDFLGRHVQFSAAVMDLNYRPLFRLCRMLNQTGLRITTSNINIHLRFSGTVRSGPRHLAWLFSKYWFEDFPLWHSKAGYKMEYDVSMSDDDDNHYKGVRTRESLENWMHLVRHAAALWRIDPEAWKKLALLLLKRYRSLRNIDRPGLRPKQPTDFQIAEESIAMISWAAVQDLGYAGNKRIPFKQGERYRGANKSAREYNFDYSGHDGYDFIHWVPRAEDSSDFIKEIVTCGGKVEQKMREMLGACYEEWEESGREESVPDQGEL